MNHLRIKLLRENARMPQRETAGSAGLDIAACLDAQVSIPPGETRMIGSGFAVAVETGYAAFIYARSGLGIRHGIIPANCVGVIDSDYRGEVMVGLRNTSDSSFSIKNGDRIAQMVVTKYEQAEPVLCDDLDDTPRGASGFGSTGN